MCSYFIKRKQLILIVRSSPSMLADAPLDNVLKRKSIQLDIYKTVEENNFQSHEERKRRRKKHKNKQRPERVDRERIHKGRRKKRLGTYPENPFIRLLISESDINFHFTKNRKKK